MLSLITLIYYLSDLKKRYEASGISQFLYLINILNTSN